MNEKVDHKMMLTTECNNCSFSFFLSWNENPRAGQSVIIYAGHDGIYGVVVRCPHCKYEQDLHEIH